MAGNKRHNRNHRDANERPLVRLAERLGGQWFEEGPLDGWIWIARQRRYMPVEIKDPAREGLVHEYTRQQLLFFTRCKATGAPWWIWRTAADVERDLGAARVA